MSNAEWLKSLDCADVCDFLETIVEQGEHFFNKECCGDYCRSVNGECEAEAIGRCTVSTVRLWLEKERV